VHGAGGQGKTRLSLQLAPRLADRHPDGLWFADLSAVTAGAVVAQHVAAVLQVREEPGRPVTASVATHIGARRILLILDNCEHVVDDAARLAATLLTGCPQLTVLATSREALEIPGEVIYRLPELGLRSDAVQLFVERALATDPAFALTDATAPDIESICARLDGNPLAIQLAARRVRFLPLAELAQRLDDRFALLIGGARTAPPRHRDLHSAIFWSYELLTADEQLVFRRISTFVGGFRLDAVGIVCPELSASALLELVLGLEAKSLVVPTLSGSAAGRFHLPESIRMFGTQQLAEAGEDTATYEHLTRWLLDLAEPAIGDKRLFSIPGELDPLDEELPTLLDVTEYAQRTDDPRQVLLAAALARCWRGRGYITEGRRILGAALAATPPEWPGRGTALAHATLLALLHGDTDTAERLAHDAVDLEADGARPVAQARALSSVATVRSALGDPAGAYDYSRRSLDVLATVGDDRDIAFATQNCAYQSLIVDDLDATAALLDRCFAAYRRTADGPPPPEWQHTAGMLALLRDDIDGADRILRAALAQHAAQPKLRVMTTQVLIGALAVVAQRQGDARRALRLASGADALGRAQHLTVVEQWHIGLVRAAVAAARGALPARDAAAAELGAADLAELVEYAQGGPVPRGPDDTLTAREREIAQLVAEGCTNRQIAVRLHLSLRTVDAHLEHIRTKLGVRSRTLIAGWVATRASGA